MSGMQVLQRRFLTVFSAFAAAERSAPGILVVQNEKTLIKPWIKHLCQLELWRILYDWRFRHWQKGPPEVLMKHHETADQLQWPASSGGFHKTSRQPRTGRALHHQFWSGSRHFTTSPNIPTQFESNPCYIVWRRDAKRHVDLAGENATLALPLTVLHGGARMFCSFCQLQTCWNNRVGLSNVVLIVNRDFKKFENLWKVSPSMRCIIFLHLGSSHAGLASQFLVLLSLHLPIRAHTSQAVTAFEPLPWPWQEDLLDMQKVMLQHIEKAPWYWQLQRRPTVLVLVVCWPGQSGESRTQGDYQVNLQGLPGAKGFFFRVSEEAI